MVGAERFQIIWVIGVRPNQITWVVGISLRGRGRKNIICQKKERSFIKSNQKKALSLAYRSGNGHFCLPSSNLGCFLRILVKNGTKINSPIVGSVAVITSLGKHVFSEEFIQGNNAIG